MLRPLSNLSRPFSQQLRHGSSGPTQWGARWVNKVRAESNITTVDDPPTSPLSESHEAGDGFADFSNYVDKGEDVSNAQIFTGMGSMAAFCYGVYRFSIWQGERATPKFTARELPEFEKSMPNWDGAREVGER